MLTVRTSISTTARPRRCAACLAHGAIGKITCAARAATASARPSCCAPSSGQHRRSRAARILFEGQDARTHAGLSSARARGIGYVPQGREIFPLLTVKENLETGYAPLKRRRAQHSRTISSSCSRCCKYMLQPARRRSVRRPAAAARDRPRAGDAAQAAGARRADRRHPALDHQGYRPGHHATCATRRHGDPAGRAVSRFLPRTGRPISTSWTAARSSMRGRPRRSTRPRRAAT